MIIYIYIYTYKYVYIYIYIYIYRPAGVAAGVAPAPGLAEELAKVCGLSSQQ